MLQGEYFLSDSFRAVFGSDGCGCLKNISLSFSGKNCIQLIEKFAYEKFTTKVKNRRTSTFFMGYAFGFETITSDVLQLPEGRVFYHKI
jgi:hypothetical protein